MQKYVVWLGCPQRVLLIHMDQDHELKYMGQRDGFCVSHSVCHTSYSSYNSLCIIYIYIYVIDRITFDCVCAGRNEIDPKGPCHIYIYIYILMLLYLLSIMYQTHIFREHCKGSHLCQAKKRKAPPRAQPPVPPDGMDRTSTGAVLLGHQLKRCLCCMKVTGSH